MNPAIEFPPNMFDLAVFSHSSWYLSEPEELLKLLVHIRPWAKRLAYAEWDLVPQNIMQVPHMLSVLLQIHLKSLMPQIDVMNIGSLILPQDARSMAETAGWSIIDEKRIHSSTLLKDGKVREIQNALTLVEQFTQHRADSLSHYAYTSLISEAKLLSDLASKTPTMSLPTYALLAE
jgi:hypothetical protein